MFWSLRPDRGSWPHTPDSWRWYRHCNQLSPCPNIPAHNFSHRQGRDGRQGGGVSIQTREFNLIAIFLWPWYNFDTICHEVLWLIAPPTVFSYLLLILTSQQLQLSWLMRFIFQDNEDWPCLAGLFNCSPGRGVINMSLHWFLIDIKCWLECRAEINRDNSIRELYAKVWKMYPQYFCTISYVLTSVLVMYLLGYQRVGR